MELWAPCESRYLLYLLSHACRKSEILYSCFKLLFILSTHSAKISNSFWVQSCILSIFMVCLVLCCASYAMLVSSLCCRCRIDANRIRDTGRLIPVTTIAGISDMFCLSFSWFIPIFLSFEMKLMNYIILYYTVLYGLGITISRLQVEYNAIVYRNICIS